MKREYIILGREIGAKKWLWFGEKAEPLQEPCCTWRPDLDNITGAVEGLKERNPRWEFKVVRAGAPL